MNSFSSRHSMITQGLQIFGTTVVLSILLNFSIGVDAKLINPPRNTVAVSGVPYTFRCESDVTENTAMQWLKLGTEESTAVDLGSCSSVSANQRYNLTGYNNTCQLFMPEVKWREAGQYRCNTSTEGEESASASLVIFRTETVSYPQHEIRTGTIVSVRIDVEYEGDMTPYFSVNVPQEIRILSYSTIATPTQISAFLSVTSHSSTITLLEDCPCYCTREQLYKATIRSRLFFVPEPKINITDLDRRNVSIGLMDVDLNFLEDIQGLCPDCTPWVISLSVFGAIAGVEVIVVLLFAVDAAIIKRNRPIVHEKMEKVTTKTNVHRGVYVVSGLILLTGLIVGILICEGVISSDCCCKLYVGLFTIFLGIAVSEFPIVCKFALSCMHSRHQLV